MGLYTEQILPRVINWFMDGKPFRALRAEALKEVSGTVLEVGFGSGLNLPFYTGGVDKLYALEPSGVARQLAGKRIRRAPFGVEFVEWNEEGSMTLPGESVDAVVTTWTLCTIPDVEAALREFRRVLKPEGLYHFLEHGRAPDPAVARWQDRWNPFQKCLAGGCHVNRPIARLIEDAGFTLHDHTNFYMDGPKILAYIYQGKAGLAPLA